MNRNEYNLEESTANMEYWLSRLQKLPNRNDREWREYFMRNDVWFEDIESLGYYLSEAHNSIVYKAYSEKTVFKSKKDEMDGSFVRAIEGALLHNRLFPETFYSLVGFTDYKEGIRVIFQQKYIKGRQPTKEEIREGLRKKGFSLFETANSPISGSKDGLFAKDIHEHNAIVSDGELYVIDCKIIKI